MKKESNAAALLPIVVFLIFYLGSGIYFEYIHPVEGGMGFYIMSAVVAFMFGLVVAFIQNRDLDFDEKIKICATSIGDENITTMLFIFLMAGAFSGVAQGAGGATSAANLLLSIIPADFAIVGLFVIACIVSMAMGTSCGTISVIVPVAMNVALGADLNLPLCVGAVIGGSMFGDNLSFISDTTIAATKTQGCKMKDKFRENFPIAFPAAIITIIILIVISIKNGGADVGQFDYNIWQALPYFGILVIALCGINVFIVLGAGIVSYFIVGIATGAATVAETFSSMGGGVSGMYETMIVTILVASMSGLIKKTADSSRSCSS
ncbi:MAG: Na+/H+ antiporter NhaC family protein [Clostridia bacterium]